MRQLPRSMKGNSMAILLGIIIALFWITIFAVIVIIRTKS